MATIKSCTDLQQSKKLAEILPLESSDMYWFRDDTETPKIYPKDMMKNSVSVTLPCWSLAALLKILAKIANKIDDDGNINLSSFMGQWSINMFDCPIEATDNYDNPIDACVAMIEKLYELKML